MSVSPVLASTRTKRVGRDGDLHLVTHGVASERGVVGFEVELEVLQQAVLAEEIQARGSIRIILVRGRLAWLWFNVELAFEPDLLLVVHGHVEEGGEVIHLAFLVGVPERGVAFATTQKV